MDDAGCALVLLGVALTLLVFWFFDAGVKTKTADNVTIKVDTTFKIDTTSIVSSKDGTVATIKGNVKVGDSVKTRWSNR